MNHSPLIVARIAAAAAAEVLLSFRGQLTVREKAPRDLVTQADVAAQNKIQSILLDAFPGHGFVGEEEGLDAIPETLLAEPDHPPIWIVDPLDGTVNYVHQLQSFAVSIAMYHAGKIQLGVVHDPICNEVYWACDGQGAYLNDRPIRAADIQRIDQALFACSFTAGTEHDELELARFAAVIDRAQSVRRLGSAALNMCYVAAGRLDGYWATSVKPWDIAAGAVIVSEAGGDVRHIDGGEFNVWQPQFVASATKSLNNQLLQALCQER